MREIRFHSCPSEVAANVRCAASSRGLKRSTNLLEHGALTAPLVAADAPSMKSGQRSAAIFIAIGSSRMPWVRNGAPTSARCLCAMKAT